MGNEAHAWVIYGSLMTNVKSVTNNIGELKNKFLKEIKAFKYTDQYIERDCDEEYDEYYDDAPPKIIIGQKIIEVYESEGVKKIKSLQTISIEESKAFKTNLDYLSNKYKCKFDKPSWLFYTTSI